jgi:hypothetical protein
MTIKFYCGCGKHLKARDEMAARRAVCPRCGSPVGIPSLKPTHAGTVAAPLTPFERRRRNRERDAATPPAEATVTAADAAPAVEERPIEDRLVRLLSDRQTRRPGRSGRSLEEHWYECLLYPFRCWRFCFILALGLSILSVVIAVLVPRLVAEAPDSPWALWVSRLNGAVFLILIVGVPCSFLDCVLTSASAGEVFYIRWSGKPLGVLLLSGTRWLTCFLAGPVLFAAAGWAYWLQCGDATLTDWLILAELGVVGAVWWIFALLSVTDRGRLRDANPVAVADVAHRLGWRGLAVASLAALLALAHGLVLLLAVAEVHTNAAVGFIMLLAAWGSGVFWSTFFCRLLGVWCHRSWQTVVTETGGKEGGGPDA